MGLDLKSFAVPLAADPVRTIRADSDLWELACDRPPFEDPWGDEALPDISRALVAALPSNLGWVHHFGDRSFGQAEYLLDPVAYRRRARTWPERKQTLAYRVIFGDESFADHADDGQGPVWRCSTAKFLAVAVQLIDALDVGEIRREFSSAEMDELGLYKVRPEEPDGQAFTRILAELRAFGEHCRQVADQGLDLIITLY